MTDFRKSQELSEVWVNPSPSLAVSQVTAEVWVTMPNPDYAVSQISAEVWVLNTPTTYMVLTQISAEVWIPVVAVAPSTYRRYNVTSDLV
jgi:hypothetical protein